MRGERDEGARDLVLAELRRGASVVAAARAAGVHRQAVYRWAERGDQEVAAALGITRGERYRHRATSRTAAEPPPPLTAELERPAGLSDELVARLRSFGLDVLAGIAADATERGSARVAAARALVEHAERWAARAAQAQALGLEPERAVEPEDEKLDEGEVLARWRVHG